MEGNTFELKFDNGDQTPCNAVATETTELVCLTNQFNLNDDLDKTVGVAVVINGLTVSHSVSFKTKNNIQGSTNLNPNTASPVLKTPIEIQLDLDFSYTLDDITAFSVNATSTTDESYVRYLNVLSVDDSTKKIRAMFGGALTGMF